MGVRNVVLTGTVVIAQTAFRWSVTGAAEQQLMVSHPALGTQIGRLTENPESQARLVGREMLKDAARTGAIGSIGAVDDAPIHDGDSEPTIF